MTHKAIVGISIIAAALLVFQAGRVVGYRQAGFSYRLGDNYYRLFGGHYPGNWGMMGTGRGDPGMREMVREMVGLWDNFARRDLPAGHGAVGTIVKVDLPRLTIATIDNVEKVVVVDDKTLLRRGREVATSTDLKSGAGVVVIGAPNSEAEIEAKLIRLLPAQP